MADRALIRQVEPLGQLQLVQLESDTLDIEIVEITGQREIDVRLGLLAPQRPRPEQRCPFNLGVPLEDTNDRSDCLL